MANRTPAQPRKPAHTGVVKAVLGPTNTGKTHLAIERLCAHSSGAIGFPLRLLAREVYDRVCAIKGTENVALITGEERIEPKGARWHLCTVEAMPSRPDLAFVALDEAQLSADPERGHIFTDRLLHTRGREETMLLGSSTLEPMVKALVPEAEIVTRPRFSTLSHVGAKKLSRIPPRSAIVAFSAEQVYVMAEMLRRFRGGAAVVMGALSPQTRNAQVAMYQAGEVDYLVATDAVGMGLNLDVHHVAFAGLSKYDGHRQRRLTTAEMAQIAGRAGRHQRDGTFGTLAGTGGHDPEFTDDEIYAIEEHRFAPLTRLYWREAEPRFDSITALIDDLESFPPLPQLAMPPQAIDLAVLKFLAEDPEVAASVRGKGSVQRFWNVCRLPDFRQQGSETHGRFVARLWQDLRAGYLGADFVAQAIAQLDNPSGDIDTLQARIAAIRSWSYIAQRPDWVLARDEMAARARAVEARLSDALHARLTERFVNRRTTVLMRKAGADAGLLPVRLSDEGALLVDDEPIGHIEGFRFMVDPLARAEDRRLLLAAAERHLPGLLASRAGALIQAATQPQGLEFEDTALVWESHVIARLERGRRLLDPRLRPDPALDRLSASDKARVIAALEAWLAHHHARTLAPLIALDEASRDPASGPELRALLLHLVESGGVLAREDSGLERLDPTQRTRLKKLGVRIGALDLFVPASLRPAALQSWHRLARVYARSGHDPAPLPPEALQPVVHTSIAPAGYRRLGRESLRVDLAEKLLHAAHATRMNAKARRVFLDPAVARSMNLSTAAYAALLRAGGFRVHMGQALPDKAFGPPQPPLWDWRPQRPSPQVDPVPERIPSAPQTGAFAALAALVAR
ncbi:MAG: helicase [Novosphingobium sp. 28-62-57]|uniref:helicase-related protein n=1 Tax=unclassified Novosphingobium TaxID=2644732 RepID=UPI000BC3665A|nr:MULTISPECIES: helicase-related protein [unclassified Novosphingobium]OYW50241.1 MAG: helicase [Novosphingobium sp. 12-62-10]OYZ11654.1 MAG: helicase [Novosphingobium sp. 28-62-57]HQS68830.1 helicase-related protein [Novosphingobium sp.]